MKKKLPNFLKTLAPWERRFSRKYRVELVHRMNEVLEEKNLSQKEVADRAGWKEPYLSRVLGGEQNLTLKTIARFEEAVGEDVLLIPLPKKPSVESDSDTRAFEPERAANRGRQSG